MKKQCEAPSCTSAAAFESPRSWCTKHWDEWFNWPDDQPEPHWMRLRLVKKSSDSGEMPAV